MVHCVGTFLHLCGPSPADSVQSMFGQTASVTALEPVATDYRNLLFALTAFCELDVASARDRLAKFANSGTDLVASPALCGEVLAATRITAVNERAIGLFGGQSPAELLGKPISALCHPDCWPDFARLLVRAGEGGGQVTAEMRLLTLAGARRDAFLALTTPASDTRRDTLLMGIEGGALSRPAVERLEASEARYRNLFHHMPLALFQVDVRDTKRAFDALRREGVTDLDAHIQAHPHLLDFAMDTIRIAAVNQHGVALFGGREEAELQIPVRHYWQDAPDTFRRVLAARYAGQRTFSEETRMRTVDGRTLDVTLTMSMPPPFEVLGMSLFAVADIGGRKRAEAQLQRLQADLAHAARIATLGELIASIAHEIAQPLSSIKMSGEASLRWLSHQPPELVEVEERSHKIIADAQRASDIIRRIRGMVSKHEAQYVPQMLNTLVQEALLFLQHELQEKGVRLVLSLAPDLPFLMGDRVQLQQVIVNLLVNAVQAMAATDAAAVHVVTRPLQDGAVSLMVRDTGPGLTATDAEIFAPFFSTKKTGMGMGLAICQSILVAHGGGITADNHPDGGAQFTIRLPAGSLEEATGTPGPVPTR